MRKIGRIVLAGGLSFLLAALCAPSAFAQEEWTDAVPARVRHFEGSVTVQRAYAGETSEAVANLPLDAGDRIWTADGGRAEVVFHDGTSLWLDQNATLDVVSLPRAGAAEGLILRLWSGSAIVYRPDDVSDRLRVDTPDASAELPGYGLFRIDVEQGERVWLSAYEGRANLLAGGLTEFVLAGERSYAEPGTAPAEAVSFNTAERDGFNSWYGDRVALMASTERHVRERSYVPRSVVHHVADLEGSGRWFYYDDFNAWAWRPVVAYGWEPYRYGRWAYAYGGWTWVPQERWGWATSHYGRWHHVPSYGWIWFPGRVYSPGWVSWYVGSGYIGWSPLGFYNRPFLSVNLWFGGHRGYGSGYHGGRNYDYGSGGRTAVPRGSVVAGRGYTAGPRGWNVVPSTDLGRPDVERHAVERSVVRASGQGNAISMQGPLRPRDPTRLVAQGGGTATSRPTVGGRGSGVVGGNSATPRPGQPGVVRGSDSPAVVRGSSGSGTRPSVIRPSVPTTPGSSVKPRPSGNSQGSQTGNPAVRPRPSSGSGGGAVVRPRPSAGGGQSGGRPAVLPRPPAGTSGSASVRPSPSSSGRPTVSPRPGTRGGATAVPRPGTSGSGAVRPRPSSSSRPTVSPRPSSGSGFRPYVPPSVAPRGSGSSSSRPGASATPRPSGSRPSVAPRPSASSRPSTSRPSVARPTRSGSGSSRPPAVSRGSGSSSRPPAVSRGSSSGSRPPAVSRGSSSGSAKPRSGSSKPRKPRKPGGGL